MIRAEGLTKVYPSFTLQDVSFHAGAGLILLGDEKGLALIPATAFEAELKRVMALAATQNEPPFEP